MCPFRQDHNGGKTPTKQPQLFALSQVQPSSFFKIYFYLFITKVAITSCVLIEAPIQHLRFYYQKKALKKIKQAALAFLSPRANASSEQSLMLSKR